MGEKLPLSWCVKLLACFCHFNKKTFKCDVLSHHCVFGWHIFFNKRQKMGKHTFLSNLPLNKYSKYYELWSSARALRREVRVRAKQLERKLWTNCYFRSSTNTQERVPRVGTNPTTLKCTFAWKIFRLWGKCFLAAIVLWSQTSRKKFKAWIWGSHLRDGRSQWLMNCSCR